MTPDNLPDIEWQGERVSRIILGTVQLGMKYGVANVLGQPDYARAREIVQAAWEAGIRHFDTAQAYGTSEEVLGRALKELGLAFEARVTSKLALPQNADRLRESIDQTLELLGVERLWCMMLHHPRFLPDWNGPLGETLEAYRRAGSIQHLGVSISQLDDAPQCLAHRAIGVLQLPCNAWDMRPVQRGLIDSARTNGQLCCIRSIYLQGLLTMTPEAVAARMPAAEPTSAAWHSFAENSGMSVKELAVRYAMSLNVALVVGAETPEQVRETVALARRGPLAREIVDQLAATMQPTLTGGILEPWTWT